MPAATTIYECADGTPFPVAWEEAIDSELPWERDAAHYPLVATPLEIELNRLARPGRLRAFENFGIQVPPLFRKVILPNGFFYMCPLRQVDDPERQAVAVSTLIAKYEGVLEFWERECLSRLQEGLRRLEASSTESVARCADIWGYALWQTQVATTVPGMVFGRLSDFCREEFGGEGEALAYNLTQGYENATVEADQALWDLAQLSRTLPAVEKALIDPGGFGLMESITAKPGAERFLAAFGVFLNSYGRRSQSWQLVAPTWQERPEIALSLIRKTLLSDAESPAEMTRRAAERRSALIEATENRLDPARRERFRTLMAPCRIYVGIREGRAYWQLVLNGTMRHQLLSRGDRLATNQVLAQKDDVFYLTAEEIDRARDRRAGNLRAFVEERRQSHLQWSARCSSHEGC